MHSVDRSKQRLPVGIFSLSSWYLIGFSFTIFPCKFVMQYMHTQSIYIYTHTHTHTQSYTPPGHLQVSKSPTKMINVISFSLSLNLTLCAITVFWAKIDGYDMAGVMCFSGKILQREASLHLCVHREDKEEEGVIKQSTSPPPPPPPSSSSPPSSEDQPRGNSWSI